MEWDIVLSDELEKLCILRIPPPVFPVFNLVSCYRDVSDRSIEPDIEDLVLIAWLVDRDSPLQIAGDASLLKPVAEP